MRYDPPLRSGLLLRRYKRFLADVELPTGEVVTAHCPNPGRMTSCLADRAPCRLTPHQDPRRKLAWTLEQVQVDGTWILVHTGRPNGVVAGAIAAGRVPELAGYEELLREQRYGSGRSRIDLLLRGARGSAWVEVKNVTLREGRTGLFPDAVSARGTRHLEELMGVAAEGHRAVLLLHVGRGDVEVVRPAEQVDPTWARTFRRAVDAGVEALAYRCVVGEDGLRLGERLPVEP